jgi:hypothetical protein
MDNRSILDTQALYSHQHHSEESIVWDACIMGASVAARYKKKYRIAQIVDMILILALLGIGIGIGVNYASL